MTSVAGSSVVGTSVAGSSVAGSSVAGSSVAGSSVAGSSVAGSSVAGTGTTTISASSNTIQYTINDFKNFMFDECLFKLSDETMSIIQAIADQVGDPEYIKTPNFPTRDGGKKKMTSNVASSILDENWKAARNFHVTTIIKKEGIYALIDAIRKHLNKMTNKTYDTIKNNIIDELKKMVEGVGNEVNTNEEEWDKLGNTLFDIASGNSFYSEMYAKLYKELMDLFPFMTNIFKKNFDVFSSVFKTVEYIDPETDYDKFCDINKTNEKRRALSLFYINLMKNNVIESDKIIHIILELNEYMFRLMDEKNNKNVVEELSEVVSIMITKGYKHTELKKHPKWKDVVKQIGTITVLKSTSKPSLSNKTIFKYMDMMDIVKVIV